MSTHASKG